MLFDLEISDKPIKDSSFNQCLWQLKKDDGIMGKFTELLTNSDNWKSSRCTMEWKAEYVKKNRTIFFLHIIRYDECYDSTQSDGQECIMVMLPTPTVNESKNSTFPKSQINRSSLIGELMKSQMARLQMLPTPTTRDANGIEHSPSQKNKSRLAPDIGTMFQETHGKTSQLNPKFVLEMMGFPTDFTEKPFNNVI